MPTYQRAPQEIIDFANAILCEFESHKPLLDAKVRIDYIFAYADLDDAGNKQNHAIKWHGNQALGLAKIVKLKDRAMGRGDAEVTLDHDWWSESSTTIAQQRALLDHELHHFAISTDEHGTPKTDDLERPKLIMRRHDYDFGWFVAIAERHTVHSQECIQAKRMMEDSGQYLMPDVFPPKENQPEAIV